MWILSILALYLLIGLFTGISHCLDIQTRLQEVGREENRLKELVGLYGMSPKGGTYYSELMEFTIQNAESLEEYSKYVENLNKYNTMSFMLGFICWPYVLIAISTKNTRERAGR